MRKMKLILPLILIITVACHRPNIQMRSDAMKNFQLTQGLFIVQAQKTISMIDDKTSDAGTIALALTLRCHNAYDEATKWLGISQFEDDEDKLIEFRKWRDSNDQMIKASIQVVLDYRNKVINTP